MRMGYFIPGWPPGAVPNGIVTALGNLERALRELGHDVFFITPSAKGQLRNSNVVVLPQSNSNLIEKLHFRWNLEHALFRSMVSRIRSAVAELVERNRIDLLEMEETHGWAAQVASRIPIPLVVRLHGPWFLVGPHSSGLRNKPENKHRIEREGQAIRQALAVSAPSNCVLSLAQQFYGRSGGLSAAIPNPQPCWALEDCWVSRRCNRSMVLFVGRFDNIKGGDLMLRAFACMASKNPKLKLVFVGPDSGVTLENKTMYRISEFLEREVPPAVRHRIDFRGPMARQDIESLRTHAGLTVIASRYETFGNVVSEAMAAGCPIVATATGGIPELLKNGSNALLVPPENVEALADACQALLDDVVLANRLAQQARQDCAEKLAPQAVAQRMVDFYNNAVAQDQKARKSSGQARGVYR